MTHDIAQNSATVQQFYDLVFNQREPQEAVQAESAEVAISRDPIARTDPAA